MLHLACEAYRSSQFRRPKPLESREVDAKSAADCVRRGVDGVAVVSPVKVGVAALFGGCWVLPGSAWFRGDRRCSNITLTGGSLVFGMSLKACSKNRML